MININAKKEDLILIKYKEGKIDDCTPLQEVLSDFGFKNVLLIPDTLSVMSITAPEFKAEKTENKGETLETGNVSLFYIDNETRETIIHDKDLYYSALTEVVVDAQGYVLTQIDGVVSAILEGEIRNGKVYAHSYAKETTLLGGHVHRKEIQLGKCKTSLEVKLDE